jgi:hypothetical protein
MLWPTEKAGEPLREHAIGRAVSLVNSVTRGGI